MPGGTLRQGRNPRLRHGQRVSAASRAAERAARDSYGRLLALLAARCRDTALAEEALAEAFSRALTHWPKKGIPGNPDAWLFTVARNRIRDAHRRAARYPETWEMPKIEAPGEAEGLPDERLALMLVCAHPAIAPDLHAPMMLQCVLGLKAIDIARLFAVSPAALAKRLTRAKAKLRDSGARFALPEPEALPPRAGAVREAIYGLHAFDWLEPGQARGAGALSLADLVARLLPEAETHGLAALIAFGHARADARVREGMLVPLDQQECAAWDMGLIRYAQTQMARAQALKTPGRFQTEAAIQEVHMARAWRGEVDYNALNRLYFVLNQMAPSAGGIVAQAAVTLRLHGPEAALAALRQAEAATGPGFQPLWATRAEALAQSGRRSEALAAYDKAISLTPEPAAARFLRARRQSVLEGDRRP